VEFEIDYFEAGNKKIEEIKKNYIKAFDLSQAPLLRAALIKTADRKHLLVLDMHHIITDGTSQDVLAKEFMALDLGKELPALRLQYKDFSKWQNSTRQRELMKQQESYWVNLFSDEFPVLSLPLYDRFSTIKYIAGKTQRPGRYNRGYAYCRQETPGPGTYYRYVCQYPGSKKLSLTREDI
jgi:hypothetical protein